MRVRCDHVGKPRCVSWCGHAKEHEHGAGDMNCYPRGCWGGGGSLKYKRVRCVPRRKR